MGFLSYTLHPIAILLLMSRPALLGKLVSPMRSEMVLREGFQMMRLRQGCGLSRPSKPKVLMVFMSGSSNNFGLLWAH